MNMNLYSNYKDSKLITPNPTTTQTAISNGLPIPTILSNFISSSLGPNGTYNTMVNDIDSGLRTTQVLSNMAHNI
jgi:hypothetical protein